MIRVFCGSVLKQMLVVSHSLQWCWCAFHSFSQARGRKQSSMLKALYSCLNLSLVFSFLCLFSFSLSLPLTHSYGSILHGQRRTAQFSTCVAQNHRTHATQSFNPLTIHSSSSMRTHSHSTDHSLIQSHANIHGQLTIRSTSHIIYYYY